jgi:hypothetical protein
MQLRALTRSATGMTDQQCKTSNGMCGLRGGRELKTTRVASQASAGWPWLRDCMEQTPTEVNRCHDGFTFPSLPGTMVPKQSGRGVRLPRPFSGAGDDKGAWWWYTEAAAKSWRRDLNLQVSSLVFGLNEQDDYFYPRGPLHRESTGRSWAANTPQMSMRWSENKQNRIQQPIAERLFGLGSCLPKLATEHKG